MLETLKAIRDLITEPDHWIQNSNAHDALGQACDPLSTDASCWCLLGACIRVTSGNDYGSTTRLYDHMRSYMPNGITEFNDSHTHAEVLALVDEAIKRAS